MLVPYQLPRDKTRCGAAGQEVDVKLHSECLEYSVCSEILVLVGEGGKGEVIVESAGGLKATYERAPRR